MTKSKRQPYIKGGVASLRQPYFLGKVVKAVGKGAKKILKSPLGKAALLGLGSYYMPGIGAKASGGWSPWFGRMKGLFDNCLLYTSPSPRDGLLYRMPSSA